MSWLQRSQNAFSLHKEIQGRANSHLNAANLLQRVFRQIDLTLGRLKGAVTIDVFFALQLCCSTLIQLFHYHVKLNVAMVSYLCTLFILLFIYYLFIYYCLLRNIDTFDFWLSFVFFLIFLTHGDIGRVRQAGDIHTMKMSKECLEVFMFRPNIGLKYQLKKRKKHIFII